MSHGRCHIQTLEQDQEGKITAALDARGGGCKLASKGIMDLLSSLFTIILSGGASTKAQLLQPLSILHWTLYTV